MIIELTKHYKAYKRTSNLTATVTFIVDLEKHTIEKNIVFNKPASITDKKAIMARIDAEDFEEVFEQAQQSLLKNSRISLF